MLLTLFSTFSLYARVDVIFISTQDPSCFGSTDGYVTIDSLHTTAPSGNYTIRINTSPPQFFNVGDTIPLGDGNYTITIFDGLDGNTPTFRSFSINEPFQLVTVTLGSTTSCFDVCDGTANVFAFDGTPPYTYLWSDGPPGQTVNNPTGLCDGKYYVTVTDNNGCTALDSAIVNEPTQVQPGVVVTDVACFGDATGSAMANPTGGTGSYPANGYMWNSSGNTTNTETGLVAGTYTVTVTDSDGCTNTETFIVGQPAAALSVTSSKSDAFCFDVANGSISTNPTGGTQFSAPNPRYTYAWSDGSSTDENRTNLQGSPGGTVYTFTVTDANGCTFVGSETIFSPTDISTAVSGTDALCNGSVDGTATASASGGIPGIKTFAWSTGNTTFDNSAPFESNETNLAQGKYYVTVTNVVGCSKVDSVEIDEPTPLVPAFDVETSPSCNGGSDGTITASASGGTPNYTFNWSNSVNNSTSISGLMAGNYTVTVIDGNGCTNTLSTTLTNPPAIDPALISIDALCFGEASGSATSTPSGGAAPYSFSWSTGNSENGSLSDTESNLLAGTYTVTVTDNNGCTVTGSIAVGQPANAVTATSSKSDAFCFGEANGSITTTPSGGTPNGSAPFYTYAWSDGPSTDQNRTGLLGSPAGITYTFTVTDANGCTFVDSQTIFSPTDISLVFSKTDVSCNGGNDGSATVTKSGGIPGQTIFDWSDINMTQTTDNTVPYESSLNGLSAGRYYVTVTNVVGCTKIDSIDIDEPTPLTITFDALTDPLCNGDANGTINVTVNGGTPTYTYGWNDGNSNEDRTGLVAGTYTLTLTDANSCTVTFDTTLVDPVTLSVSIDSLEDASCNGLSDGYARALGAGGTIPYTYAWQGGPSNRENPNLAAGTYTVTVTDNNGCTVSTTATVGQPITLVANISSTDASCAGVNDGTATASGTGGTAPYTFLWNPPGSQTSAGITGLAGGTYTVTVTDNNGCTDEESVVINQPTAISLTTSQTNVLCNGDATGEAVVTATGGTQPYTYAWMPGGATSDTAKNLTAQTYTVTVTDNNGCSNTASVTITEPSALTATITSSTDPTCNGINDGSATVTANGGTGNYTYLWAPDNEITSSITGKGSRTYTVTVTDNNGCTAVDQVTLTAPPSVVIAVDSISNVSCNGGNDGYIGLDVTGGNIPYTYSWSNSAGNVSVNPSLLANTYTVTVEDNNGCQEIQSFTITEPALALSSSSTTTDILCNGDDDGTATITVNGGTPAYTYNWPAPIGLGSDNESNLDGGTYDVTISDANGCTIVESIIINEPNPLVVSINSTNVSCNGANDGTATASSIGGTSPYTYNWTPPATGDNISSLAPGNYTVTVTDNNGCTDSSSVTITEDNLLTVNLVNFQNVQCNGNNDGIIEVIGNGGSPAYTYAWSAGAGNTGLNDNLGIGSYTVTVTDGNGCTATLDTTITEPTVLTVSINVDKQPCTGANDGELTANETGGTGPYTYAWSGTAQTTKTVTNLGSGFYIVTVTDNNGCTAVDNQLLTPSAPILVFGVTGADAVCFGEASGTAIALAGGGTGQLTYNWSNGRSGFLQQNLLAGTYTVTISDGNGCTEERSTTIGQPAQLDPALTTVDEACNGSSNGSATSTPTGGTGDYTFNWSTGQNDTAVATSSIINLSAGTYTLTLSDANGCDTISTFTINGGIVNYTYRDSVVHESCFGFNDGYIEILNLSGGTAPITYSWSTGSIGTSISGLSAGIYTVTIQDANACDSIQSFTINQGRAINSITTSIDETCALSNGQITITPFGGLAPYTFDWSHGFPQTIGNSSTITGLSAGTYSVTITESGGCSAVDNITILPGTGINFTSTSNATLQCFGDNTGDIAISNLSGGTPPYTFNWSDIGIGINNRQNLFAGTYTLTISDFSGSCDTVETFVITEPNLLDPVITSTNSNCSSGGTGSITSTPTGGTGDYTFNWSTGQNDTAIATSSIMNLGAGTYTLTLSDANGCDTITSINITSPVSLTASVTAIDDTCLQTVGSAVVPSVTGGTPPYTYRWSGGTPSNNMTTDLSAGNYTVTVEDNVGCDTTIAFTINNFSTISINDSVVNVTCNGNNDGKIFITNIGGINPVTYNWSVGFLVGANPTNVPPGTYSITVTDAAGCAEISSISVTQPNLLEAAVTTVDESCTPGNDGSASAVITGGTPPYTYDWGAGNTSANNVNGLSGGAYNLTVVDSNGCQTIEPYFIFNTSSFTSNVLVTDASCNGGMDGEIQITLNGAVPLITYQWAGGLPASPNQTGLIEGNYFVTITDGTGCSITEAIRVNEDSPITVDSIPTNDESCSPGNDGNAKVYVSGGMGPYTYTFSGMGNQFNDSIADLSAGFYSVTIEDANACSEVESFRIEPGDDIDLNDSIVDPLCFGDSNGEIYLRPTGGSGSGYSYMWDNGSTQSFRTGLSAGNYRVTVSDGAIPPCTKVENIGVSSPSPISASFVEGPESCVPGGDGSAFLTPNGGTGPYTVSSPAGTVFGTNVFSLSAGNYTVTITDANMCTGTKNFTIGTFQPATLSSTVTDATCFGGNDGSVVISVMGGANPLTYIWSGGGLSGATNNGIVSPGTYTVTVNDRLGCSATETVTVGQGAQIQASFVTTGESCNPGNDGSATITITSGGTAPFTYDWGAGNTNQTSNTGLAAGNYDVTVSDDNGCTEIIPYIINSDAPFALSGTVDSVSCHGLADGQISQLVTGQSGTIVYNWDDGSSQSGRTGLAAGTYSVTVTDQGTGCTETAQYIVGQPDDILISFVTTEESCNPGSDGTITLTPSGGNAGQYTYQWSGGLSASANQTGLVANTYSVTVFDSKGCSSDTTIDVILNPGFTVILAATDIRCNGANNGFIALSTNPDVTANATYLWSDGRRNRNRGGLAPNNYSVTVTDGNTGCTAVASASISEPTAIVANVTPTDESCIPGSDGSATVIASGGTTSTPGLYTYTWPISGQTNNNVEIGLTAGNYNVTVQDDNGCTAVVPFTINQAAPFTVDLDSTDITCNGANDGTATVTTTATNPTYQWSVGISTSSTISNLSQGKYLVTVTDQASGCTAIDSISINEPSLIVGNITTTPESCVPGNDGTATGGASGGTIGTGSDYVYSWSVGSVGPSISGLSAGTYTVTISDDNSCTVVDNFTVGSTAPFNVNSIIKGVSCNGLRDGAITLNITGASGTLLFSWNDAATTQNRSSLFAGTYDVTITDQGTGCTETQSFNVPEPNRIDVTIVTSPEDCIPGGNGQATASAIGGSSGSGDYTYDWSTGVRDIAPISTITNLAAGNYRVSVTDDSLCVKVENVVVGTAASFTIDLDSLDVNCNGGNNGRITISSSLTNFNFNWSTGNTTDNPLNNLAAGQYKVTVTDPGTGCTQVDSIVINEPTLIDPNVFTTPESCVPGNDGTALGNATGGAPNSTYTYNWSNGQNAVNPIIGLSAGTYTVTVFDDLGCSNTETFNVGSVAPFNVNADIKNTACNGGNDGSIDLTVTGATGGLLYDWGSGITTEDRSNLTAGNYTVTITDQGNGCTETNTYTITEPTQIMAQLVTVDATCNPGNDGRVRATATGGSSSNGRYTFEWSSGGGPNVTDTSRVFSLAAGNYSLTITDDSSCSIVETFTIGSSAPFIVADNVSDVTCNGLSDGSISLTVTGNSGTISYAWDNGLPSQASQSNLSGATYNVTITDQGNGCTEVKSYTVNEPDPIIPTVSVMNESCSPGNDGSALATATGGTVSANYTFNWSNGFSGNPITGLVGGNYDVTVIDDNNCSVVEPFTILPGNKINPNETVSSETCSGACDGSIILNPSGGSGSYTYNWDTGETSKDRLNLCGGTYTVTISDGGNCDTTMSFTINSNSPLVVNVTTKDQSCTSLAVCDGEAYAQVSGGLAPYTYIWGAGTVSGVNPDTATSICVGNYDVTITDASGCSVIEPFTINGPPPLGASFNINNPSCNICNGDVTVTASGGVGSTYTYEWYDSGLNPLGNTTDNLSGICAGIYFVDITDNTGCSDRFSVGVSDNGAESVTVTKIDASCFGECDGSATANYVCLDPNCSVEWFNGTTGVPLGVTSNTASNLCAGDYFVQVTNNSGCIALEPVTIGSPSGFLLSSNVSNVTCFGGFDGSISVNVSGGSGNYTYVWAPGPISGQGTSNISALSAGMYNLTLIDDSGCDSVFTFNVNAPSEIQATFTNVDPTCDVSNGSISASVSGGTVSSNYTYQWLDGQSNPIIGATGSSLSNIGQGTYYLVVNDDNNCERTFLTTLSNTDGPTVVVDSTKDIQCFGDQGGAIFITASGPNSPFTYNWLSQGQTTEDIFNLNEGTYVVGVSDALGCITYDTASVQGPSQIIANITSENANCGSCDGIARMNVSGGVPPFTYLWSNGSVADTASGLCAGAYTAVVSDANGCSETFDFTINNTGGPTGETVSVSAASCASSCDGSATVIPRGGTSPYTYLWLHNGATTNSLSNLCAGSYTLQVTDVSGCNRLVHVDVSAPAELTAKATIVAQTCQSNPCDGSIRVDVSGGTRPYSFDWGPLNLPNSNVQNGLCAGIYNVTITDANGCRLIRNYSVVNSGNTITTTPTVQDVSCYGSCDGSLISNVVQIVGVTYQWFNDQGQAVAPQGNDLIGAACAGDYFLEITQFPDGCKNYYNVSVEEPDSILLNSTIVNNISCNGACDGEIFISTSGGNILYNYSWNDPNNQDGIPVVDLCAGTYGVTATDANGCTASTSVTLVDPPALILTINGSTNLTCSSNRNATANVSGNGGTTPYTFTWSGGQIGDNPTDLGFGPNIVTLTDATGCSVEDTVFISATDTVVAIVPSNNIICGGDSIFLDGELMGSSITSFGWYEGTTSNLLTNSLDTTISRPFGDYTFYLIASNGSCSDTSEYKVSTVQNPSVGLAPSVTIYKNEIAIFKLTGKDPTYQYAWSPNIDLNDSSLAEPQASAREDRYYTLVVTDTNGCQYIDSILLDYEKELDIPSGISPNADGVNDTWEIEFLDEFPNAKVYIYNRWGKLIYEQKNGYNVEWDGTYEGKALPIGTYYYVIDLGSPRFEPMTGPITIVK